LPNENALMFLRSLATTSSPPNAIAVAGPQAFLREYVPDAFRGRVVPEGFQYRSCQIGGADGFDAALRELDGADLFAPKRLIACRLLRSYRERASTDDENGDDSPATVGSGGEAAFVAALERLAPTIRLALICDRDTVPAKLRRAVEQKGTVVNCARPFDNQLGQYAGLFARDTGRKLAPAATDLLITRHGGDLNAMANSIRRAALTTEGEILEAAAFGESGALHVPELFELADALARGIANETLALFGRAIQIGRDPIEMLAVEIIPLVRRMLAAAAMLEARKSNAAIAGALGLPPQSSMVTRAIDGARKFGLPGLQAAHQRACELDEQFKMGLIKERENAIAQLILDLMTRTARAA
jgi:DNA polymerase III delta subunit